MVVAWLIVIIGLVFCGWGLTTARRFGRPKSWVGAVVAAAGLLVALWGLVRLLVPAFF